LYCAGWSDESDSSVTGTEPCTSKLAPTGGGRIVDNVKAKVQEYGITYPVAIDNYYAIWRNFDNQYWPAHYLIDASGQVRYTHFGEGRYDEQEKVIQQLLEEARQGATAPDAA
jgi:hypothetical protein